MLRYARSEALAAERVRLNQAKGIWLRPRRQFVTNVIDPRISRKLASLWGLLHQSVGIRTGDVIENGRRLRAESASKGKVCGTYSKGRSA
jgi:hypothetical protein